MNSESIEIKNKHNAYEGDNIYIQSVEDDKYLYIANSENEYYIRVETQDLLDAIKAVRGNKPCVSRELLGECAIALWKDVFFNTAISDTKQKIETANVVVDEFYKKLG